MKKIFAAILVILATGVFFSVSAFAEEPQIGSSIYSYIDSTGMRVTVETFEDGSQIITYDEDQFEEIDPDELVGVCPKCGEIHEGSLCKKEAPRAELMTLKSNDGFKRYSDLKGSALYYVTADHKLMLMNLVTKQLYYVADNVKELCRFGMNGRYIGYMTSEGKFFSVPFEVDDRGRMSSNFQDSFGE